MSAEFVSEGPTLFTSVQGFALDFSSGGFVGYFDEHRKIEVGVELILKPTTKYVIHASSEDLRGLPPSEAQKILDRVKRGLEFVGHSAEIVRWY